MHAIVTIHDVMPHTLDGVCALTELIPPEQRSKIALLVVPGVQWETNQIERVRQLNESGFSLAGHGWQHCTPHIRGIYHRLHSLLISRKVAEHLSYSRKELFEVLQRNYEWFKKHRFPAPDFYVPPAWAMGKLSREDLTALPFRYYEDSQGIFDSNSNCYRRLPLTGFEADTALREYFLRFWNLFNIRISSSSNPVRISLHPYDLEYRLEPQLRQFISKVTHWHSVNEIFDIT